MGLLLHPRFHCQLPSRRGTVDDSPMIVLHLHPSSLHRVLVLTCSSQSAMSYRYIPVFPCPPSHAFSTPPRPHICCTKYLPTVPVCLMTCPNRVNFLLRTNSAGQQKFRSNRVLVKKNLNRLFFPTSERYMRIRNLFLKP